MKRHCYGGSAVIRLGSTSLVHSVVICHPGAFAIPEAKAIKVCSEILSFRWPLPLLTMLLQVPASWVCAEGSNDIYMIHRPNSLINIL